MDFRTGRPRARPERRQANGQQNWEGVERRHAGLAVICWRNSDGSEAASHPLPRPHAEALMQAFRKHYPLPSYWLVVPAALEDSSRYR